MCYCDFDPPEFYNHKTVVGRKQHRCVECLRVIEIGEEQEVASGKWEGDFETFRTCKDCVSLRKSMGLDCFAHGMLVDDVSQADPYTDDMKAFRSRFDENYRRLQATKQSEPAA